MKKLTDRKIAEILGVTPQNILFWKRNKPLQYEAVKWYLLFKENEISKKIKKIVKKNNVKFIINDKPIVAKIVDADGCHIGQKDMDFASARKILGKNKIIGVTCHNSKKLALKAKKHGANYVAFGSFFKSQTKKTAFKANLAILRWAKKKINMPIVALGGINNSNYKKILSNGANFIACSSYIWNNKKLDTLNFLNELNLSK